MRRWIFVLIALGALIAVAYLAGPRVAADTTVSFDPTSIGDDPEAYLAAREAEVPGIRPGLQKEIVWAFPASKARTPLAIVYVHGFSASKGELRPLPDIVGRDLGANIFYTRLTGHGRDGEAMAEGSVNAWVNDYAEAIAIGRRIGERVIVMATSTGGTLAVWAAANRLDLDQDVSAMVLVSPNLGIQAAGSFLLTQPWGGQLARLLIGPTRGFEPTTDLQRHIWTYRYPTRALLPMAALTEAAASSEVEKVSVPALFIISDRDQVVRPEVTREIAARWGAAHEIYAVTDSDDPSQHVIAGDAYSPSTTDATARKIVDWINALPR